MGKRSKVANTEVFEVKKKKSKLSKQKVDETVKKEIDLADLPMTKQENIINVKKKDKPIKNQEIDEKEQNNIGKQNKKLSKVAKSDSNKGPIKTIFVDGEPQKVDSTVKAKEKKFLNDDEAEIKEEDIDKFIEDIEEEDNQQYEDWVKLVEAKLHSNSKKNK